MNWNNIVGMVIGGSGAIFLAALGIISGDAAVGLLGAVLGYAFGYQNGNRTKEQKKAE